MADASLPAVSPGAGVQSKRAQTSVKTARLKPAPVEMPPGLLRGVPMCRLLHSGGVMMRRRADSLPHALRERLYESSVECEWLSCFISHSWQASGVLKYLTLAFHFLAKRSLVMGVVATCASVLVQFYFFELAVTRPCALALGEQGSGSCTVTVVETLVCVITMWSTLLFGHLVLHKTSTAFFDCCCIHQTDIHLKLQGIKHLAGFVEHSKQFLLLWDASYFERLWCVYELATFSSRYPDRHVVVLPTLLVRFTAQVHGVYCTLCLPILLILRLTSASSATGAQQMSIIVVVGILGTLAITFALVAFGAHYKRIQHQLLQELQAFDMRAAACSVAADRDKIEAGVKSMYGDIDAFNQYVREQLVTKIRHAMANQRAPVPYQFVILMIFPMFGPTMMDIRNVLASPPLQSENNLVRAVHVACNVSNFCFVIPVMQAITLELGARMSTCPTRLALASVVWALLSSMVHSVVSTSPVLIARESWRLESALLVASPYMPAHNTIGYWIALPFFCLVHAPFVLACIRFYAPSQRIKEQ